MHKRLLPAGVVVICLATTVGAANASQHVPPTARNGAWIAYSTAPITGGSDGHGLHGSDVYVVREGDAPILVATRNDTGNSAKSWHKCPAFSPDGAMLAYGTRSQGKLSISVLPVTASGPGLTQRVTLKVEGRSTRVPCPQWSPDGSLLANVNAREVIDYALDGSKRPVGARDPRIRAFQSRRSRFLVSPSGDLVARTDRSCRIIIERRDGSHRREFGGPPCAFSSYGLAAWSPDERRVLAMEDVGGGFSMFDISVDAPFEKVPVVEDVIVNNARSWPARYDVSWQPERSSVTSSNLTVRDALGDTVKDGKKQSGHRYADIRSVRLGRPDRRTLRVVVETVAPLRVESYVTFRYVAPTGDDEVELTALRGRGSLFISAGDPNHRTRHVIGQRPAVALKGNRITLNLDYGIANNIYYLPPYRRFRWAVKVESDDGFSDTLPNRHRADSFASFPG